MSYEDKKKINSKIYYQKNKKEILEKNKEWRKKNKEKIKINDKIYYQKNKEKISESKKEWRKKNKEKIKKKRRERYLKEKDNKIKKYNESLNGKIRRDLNSAKTRAKKKNIEYTLTYDMINKLYKKQKGICAISGIKMELKIGHDTYSKNPYIMSIDRIDSLKGYIIENIQLVCNIINTMKSDLEMDEFNSIIKKTYIKLFQ